MYEINEIIEEIQKSSTTDINVIYGSAINSDLGNEIIVTVIATGFSEDPIFKSTKFEMPEEQKEPVPEPEPVMDNPDKKKAKKKKKLRKAVETESKTESEEQTDISIPSWLKERFKK